MPVTKTRTKKSNLPQTIESNRLNNGQLRVQVGCRIRLSDDDKTKLKLAYKAKANEEMDQCLTPNNSYVAVSTMYNTPILNREMGLDSMLFTQLLAGRDALTMGLVLRFQRVLGVEVVSNDFLHQVFDTYLEHISTQNSEPSDG